MLALTNFITKVNILIKLKKTMKIFKNIFLLSFLLSFFLLSGCDLTKTEHLVHIKMINNSNLETHLWTNNESIAAYNKVAPGASRSAEHRILIDHRDDDWFLGSITAYAGRNGATLTSLKIEIDFNKAVFCTIVYSGGALSATK